MHLALCAVIGFLQGDIDLSAQIIPAARLSLAAATGATGTAEKLFENITNIAKAGKPTGPTKAALATKAAALLKGGMAKLVISGARLVVFQHFIGL